MGPHGEDGCCSRGVAFAAAPRPFVLLRAGPPVWDRPKRWYHPHDRGDVAQLGERGVRNAEVGSSILLVSTTPMPKGRLHAGPFSFWGMRWLAATRPVCPSGSQQQPCCRSRSQSLGSFCPWHHVFQGRHRNGPADQTLQRCHLRRAA